MEGYQLYPEKKAAGKAKIVKIGGKAHLVETWGKEPRLRKVEANQYWQDEKARLVDERTKINDHIDAIRLIQDDVIAATEI